MVVCDGCSGSWVSVSHWLSLTLSASRTSPRHLMMDGRTLYGMTWGISVCCAVSASRSSGRLGLGWLPACLSSGWCVG